MHTSYALESTSTCLPLEIARAACSDLRAPVPQHAICKREREREREDGLGVNYKRLGFVYGTFLIRTYTCSKETHMNICIATTWELNQGTL